ncbi:unnamed protein product, partial [marine sediment metagenome]
MEQYLAHSPYPPPFYIYILLINEEEVPERKRKKILPAHRRALVGGHFRTQGLAQTCSNNVQ